MELLTRLFDWFEKNFPVRRLLFVIAAVSGGLLFDVFGITSGLDLEAQVTEYRLWFLLVLAISAGLLAIDLVMAITAWVGRAFARAKDRLVVEALELSTDAQLILILLHSQEPDSVPLKSEHWAVRELRRTDLVGRHLSMVFPSETDQFFLTDRGRMVLRKIDPKVYNYVQSGDQLDFWSEVTGRIWRRN
jgi:hypothetical protein